MNETAPSGANGVELPPVTRGDAGYRTYEVYQRERVGQSTEKMTPGKLASPAFQTDPYPYLAILREHYPCYRDWQKNAFWVTRYDDVTSILADEANFETRSAAWHLGVEAPGQDLLNALEFETAWAESLDAHAAAVAERIARDVQRAGEANLALDFAGRYALELLCTQLGLGAEEAAEFAPQYWALKSGAHWHPTLQQSALASLAPLTTWLADALSRDRDNTSLLAVGRQMGATAGDFVATLLELDHETLHGSLANLWCALLHHPEGPAAVSGEARLMKIAWLESIRYTTPVLAERRYARQEVERFGRLIPQGALVICSAAAANRDPRVFADPDTFVPNRRDICHREARGQYRADGLATGIAVRLGTPSKHPAAPEDRPRSRFALTRDTAVTASRTLLNVIPTLELKPGAEQTLHCRHLGHMHACWDLPVVTS